MVKLSAIIENVKTIRVVGSTESAITSLRMDSRKVAPDSLFFAIKGLTSDGHNFIPQAIETGAVAVVCENIPETQQEGVTYLQVDDALVAMAVCASSFFGNPSESISLIGVTGTNGKTTIATLLFKLFRAMGYRCGLISTVRNMIDDIEIPSTHTTPDVIMLNSLLAGMVEAGCAYCFIEVSSHATEQKRVYGLTFSGGIFTNITHDHLDYHGTFANYLKAKQRFFEMLGADAFALFNNDDRNGQIMLQTCRADKYSYGLKTAVDYKCRVVENHFDGQLLNVNGEEVWTRLIGEFNAYNFTAIYAAATLVGLKPVEFLPALSNLTAVEGRFQYFMGTGGIVGIVDYAHTPDALTNVIETINGIRKSGSSLITVIGCGGDRDAAKRPIMAQIASKGSDSVVLTSDNPRSEDPNEILAQMQAGIPIGDKNKVFTIENRKEAIRTACAFAKGGDVVLVAGKGHEKYQEIKGVKYPFDDLAVLIEMLNKQ